MVLAFSNRGHGQVHPVYKLDATVVILAEYSMQLQ